ncbi:hypothetical protein [Helicobacter cinaedi]|uniref:hypothetical protein n=1 Tax=Helicobacter cinaedi TaxID=213 RepID=UPI001559F4A5|nr:hypothetical protein [Helicobacter cinaedi]
MQINLKMLKVLILGGSRGIGLEIAKALHSVGGGVNACILRLWLVVKKHLRFCKKSMDLRF